MKKILLLTTSLWLSAGQLTTAQVLKEESNDIYFELSKNLEIISNVFKELNNYYVDPINPGQLTHVALTSLLQELDPYTIYYPESEKEEFEFQTTGKYGGIGTSIEVFDSIVYIGDIVEGGPLHKAGVVAGHEIVSIDDVVIKGKGMDEISLLLRGAVGTPLSLVLKHPKTGVTEKKVVNREYIEMESVPYYNLVGANKDYAYVFLSQFTDNCSQEIKKALETMKKENPNMKGVILDLRSNPGGLMHEAVNICNLFLPKDRLIVTTKGNANFKSMEYKTTNEPWDTEIPLVVLINNRSASASEVVAGTIQDLDRGVVIGTKSFGKGLVQNIIPLGYNTSLKVTIAKYYTPSGRCIQAIDYSHKNVDGSVSNVPDSLKQKFFTKNGRVVHDGGGVDPDIVTKDMDVNRTIISLITDGPIFKYATDYFYKNPSIKSPEEFYISDKEYQDFIKWMDQNKFNTETVSDEYLASFEKFLEQEKYLDDAKLNFENLKKDIENSKKKSLTKSSNEIKLILSNEIVSRYYYQRGRVVNRLFHNDLDMEKSFEILSDKEAYKKLLK